MSNFFGVYECDFDSKYSVTVEDDGRVAYAYLLENNEHVVSDVWLYNQQDPPLNADWRESDMPFLNPQDFLLAAENCMPLLKTSDVIVNWNCPDNKIIIAIIFIREQLTAILQTGTSPGWSAFVKKDGPLAKKWHPLSE